MKKKLPYQKPHISVKKVKMNFFLGNPRVFDAFDELLAPKAFAQYGGGGGSCCTPPPGELPY